MDLTMEVSVVQTKRVTVDRLRAECGVRYWEDATVNGQEDSNGDLIPLRMGDAWCPTIMLATGQILDWPQGATAALHYKVCDDGRYSLLTPTGDVASTIDGYVPKIMCPGGAGYGDYVIMSIDENGIVDGWEADISAWEGQPAPTAQE